MKHSKIQLYSIITYIFLLGINFFMLFFLRNYFNLLFFAALIIAPVFSFVCVFFLRRNIKLSLSGASIVENRLHEFKFSIHVDNPSVLFANNCVIYITVSNALFGKKNIHSINLPINPLMESTVDYPVKSPHCGVITVSIDSICIYDFFNIFRLKKDFNVIREITIFPNMEILDDEFTMDFSEGYDNLEESTIKGNESSEVSDIREYIPGDKLQNIHWKLSAKKELLMVKEHISLTSTQLLFYIELADLKNQTLDMILDYAYGIGAYLCNENIPFSFLWYSIKRKECRTYLILCMEQLKEAICEILFEIPFENYKEIRQQIPMMCGHENFITIGADYVLEKEEETK